MKFLHAMVFMLCLSSCGKLASWWQASEDPSPNTPLNKVTSPPALPPPTKQEKLEASPSKQQKAASEEEAASEEKATLEEEVVPEEEVAPEKPEPKILFAKSQELTKLSVLNRSNSFLTLDDKIIFPAFTEPSSQYSFFEMSDLEEMDYTVKISTLCSANDGSNRKAVKEIIGIDYVFEFSFFQIIPEEVLLEENERSFSCSFIFAFKDQEGGLHHYVVTQQPILSRTQEKDLKLSHKLGKNINSFVNVQKRDVDNLILLPDDSSIYDNQILFTCRDFDSEIMFNFRDVIPDKNFFDFILVRSKLPQGVAQCRIITQDRGLLRSMTQLFKVDFKKLTEEPALVLDLEKLKYTLHNRGPTSFTREAEEFSEQKEREKYAHPYLFASFQLTGLPKDFYIKKYSPVQIKVQTTCVRGKLIPDPKKNTTIVKNYVFPLTEEFSIMSVTPEEVFQLYYTNFKKENLSRDRKIQKMISYSDLRDRSQRENMRCNYNISVKNPHKLDSQGNPQKQSSFHRYTLQWSAGSYGVSLSSNVGERLVVKSLKERSSLRPPQIPERFFASISWKNIQDEVAGQFNLLFLHQLAHKNFWDNYPNQMTLKCGSIKKEDQFLSQDDYLFVNWPINNTEFSIPASVILSHPLVEKYLKKNKVMKCRLLFYTNEILKYFSSEMKVYYKP